MEHILDEIQTRYAKLYCKPTEKLNMTFKAFQQFLKDSSIENFVDVLETGN